MLRCQGAVETFGFVLPRGGGRMSLERSELALPRDALCRFFDALNSVAVLGSVILLRQERDYFIGTRRREVKPHYRLERDYVASAKAVHGVHQSHSIN